MFRECYADKLHFFSFYRMRVPPLINTLDEVKEKLQLLEVRFRKTCLFFAHIENVFQI